MSQHAPGWRMRGLYLAEVLLLGAPTVFYGGIIAGLGLLVGVGALLSGPSASLQGLWLAGWGLAGWVGMISWLRLSAAYLLHGAVTLRECRRIWWWGLLVGVLAAAPLGFMIVQSWWESGVGAVPLHNLFLGPVLIVPAAHLTWLALRREDSR